LLPLVSRVSCHKPCHTVSGRTLVIVDFALIRQRLATRSSGGPLIGRIASSDDWSITASRVEIARHHTEAVHSDATFVALVRSDGVDLVVPESGSIRVQCPTSGPPSPPSSAASSHQPQRRRSLPAYARTMPNGDQSSTHSLSQPRVPQGQRRGVPRGPRHRLRSRLPGARPDPARHRAGVARRPHRGSRRRPQHRLRARRLDSLRG
jgi:hypothetical protein